MWSKYFFHGIFINWNVSLCVLETFGTEIRTYLARRILYYINFWDLTFLHNFFPLQIPGGDKFHCYLPEQFGRIYFYYLSPRISPLRIPREVGVNFPRYRAHNFLSLNLKHVPCSYPQWQLLSLPPWFVAHSFFPVTEDTLTSFCKTSCRL